MKQYRTGMVFGIYEKIEDRHAKLLKKAAEVCDRLYIAVSSDEEVKALAKRSPTVPLETREHIVEDFCTRNSVNARVLAFKGKHPDYYVQEYRVDAYVLSDSQYERFGKELERLVTDSNPHGKIIPVTV